MTVGARVVNVPADGKSRSAFSASPPRWPPRRRRSSPVRIIRSTRPRRAASSREGCRIRSSAPCAVSIVFNASQTNHNSHPHGRHANRSRDIRACAQSTLETPRAPCRSRKTSGARDSRGKVLRDYRRKVLRDSRCRVLGDSRCKVLQDSHCRVLGDSRCKVLRDSRLKVLRDHAAKCFETTPQGVLGGLKLQGAW